MNLPISKPLPGVKKNYERITQISLVDDDKTIEKYGIQPGSILQIDVPVTLHYPF